MKKLVLLSVAGITSLALTQAGWAAGHGGGGGFHGNGFGGGLGGGDFHGGVFGGGRGFGGVRSSYRQPVYNRSANRSITPSVRSSIGSNRQQNRFEPSNQTGQGSRPTSQFLTPSPDATSGQKIGLNGRTDHVYQSQAADSHPDWDRRRVYYSGHHWWANNGSDWIGLDPGFYPWDYYPYYTYDYYPYDYFISDPTDLPPAYQDTTSSPPAPDPTVTAAQTQLSEQGYYGGPIDGLFGPTTRDAVASYQAKQNLTVSGSLTPDTLRALGLPSVATN
jgi:hypothetical protein